MTPLRWAGAAVLLVLGSTGMAHAAPFTAAEDQLIVLLPPGYTAASCTRATNPFPAAIASLDCRDAANTDTPDYARFTLYDTVAALNTDFDASVASMSVTPCPNGNPSPGDWNYGPDLSIPGGKVVCGSIADQADVAWTRDGQLLLATVNGGPSLDDLYQWWQRYAATGQ